MVAFRSKDDRTLVLPEIPCDRDWNGLAMKGAILVVEDADETRELLAELLMREGYHAVMAADGEEALSRMDLLVPDLVVTDLEMPKLDGHGLIAAMAKRPDLRNVPVCLLSGAPPERPSAGLPGAPKPAVTLRKPVKLTDFLAVVAKLIAGTGAAA